jgi:iron complex outermembrane receptor protein
MVTAQKRVQRLQDVPIAVSVIDSKQLVRQQVNVLTDLQRTTPELEFSGPDQGPGGGATIRGIGTQVFAFSGEPSVGVVVDGVSLGVGYTNNIFDVSRVEILPGPQGMLFGQSASAGLVNITTNAPDFSRFSGSLYTELSSRGLGSDSSQYVTRLVLNVPLTNVSALRISAHYNDSSIQYDAYSKKYDDDSDPGIRARYKYENDGWTVNLIGDYDRQILHGGQFLTFVYVPPGSGLQSSLAQCGITAGFANAQNCDQVASAGNYETAGLSGQIDRQIGDYTLTYIGAWRENAFLRRQDTDTFPTNLANGVVIDNLGERLRGAQVTQELRLATPASARLEYTVGLYYSDYSQYHTQPSFAIFPQFGVFSSFSGDNVATDTATEAVFGQATFHITPEWRIIAGGRGTLDKVKDDLTDIYDSGSASVGDFQRNISWRFGTQYAFNRNAMAFFTVSRGFKGPLVNDSGSDASSASLVKPEIPLDYELGTKTTFLHGRLAVDATLFHTTVKDFQGQGCFVNADHLNQCGAENISSVTSQGGQLNVFGRPLPGLTLNAGATYSDARYPKGFLASDGTDLGGAELLNDTLWKVVGSGEYSYQINDNLAALYDADMVYKTKELLYPTAAQGFAFHAHTVTGMRLGIDNAAKGWNVSIFVRNLFDVHEPLTLYPFPITFAFANTPRAIWGDFGTTTGRLVGLSGTLKF